MSFLGVTYIHDRDENFKEFLDQLPLPPEMTAALLNSKPKSTLVKDGDTYTSTTTSPAGEKSITFESGVEFVEKITDSVTANTTFTVEDNVVTQEQKFGDGKAITYKREYVDNELIVSLNVTGWDGTGKRFYVAE